MKKFAGINLNTIDPRSVAQLRSLRATFLEHYRNKYMLPENSCAAMAINFLDNYYQVNTTPNLHSFQTLAMIIKRLPDDQQLVGNVDDNLTLLVLKIVFRQHGFVGDNFKDLGFGQRCALIQKLQRKICYHDDWEYAVNRILKAFNRKSMQLSYFALDQIIEMPNLFHAAQKCEYQSYLLSLQICEYVKILDFVIAHPGLADINLFGAKVFRELLQSLNRLKSLSELKCKNERSSYHGVFFSRILHDPLCRVLPEEQLKIPLLSSKM
jgi:hypothetical protein